jgi:hypothetical protein
MTDDTIGIVLRDGQVHGQHQTLGTFAPRFFGELPGPMQSVVICVEIAARPPRRTRHRPDRTLGLVCGHQPEDPGDGTPFRTNRAGAFDWMFRSWRRCSGLQ